MIKRAEVRVDLANTSCVVTDGNTQHGQWAPGVTRRSVDKTIAAHGWRFVPGSTWTTTPDGGTRPVFHADEAAEADLVEQEFDDALLDALGGRDTVPVDQSTDELCTLFLALREHADRPAPELVSTDEAARAIAAVRTRRFRRIHLTVAAVVGAVGVPLTVLLDGSRTEIALAFPAGALSYLLIYALLERVFGGVR